MKTTPSRNDIFAAMRRYDVEGMPEGFGPSVHYLLIHPKTQVAYPPKAIWGLATGTIGFNAVQAKRWLEKLAFYVHDRRLEQPTAPTDAVARARNSSHAERQARLATAPTRPDAVLTLVTHYRRNPDVIAERLEIAQGHCENCGAPAPFLRTRDGTPYLEVHHVIALSDGGPDTVANCRAMCPNCHRKAHFG